MDRSGVGGGGGRRRWGRGEEEEEGEEGGRGWFISSSYKATAEQPFPPPLPLTTNSMQP